jgi:hypothetical protein
MPEKIWMSNISRAYRSDFEVYDERARLDQGGGGSSLYSGIKW